METAYTFRTLTSKDIFPMAKILNKIGVGKFKDALCGDEILKLAEGENNAEKIGITLAFEIAGIVLEGLPKCENEIFEMLSSVSNLSRNEIESLDMGTFFEMIVDFVKKPEFRDFIGVVSKLFK